MPIKSHSTSLLAHSKSQPDFNLLELEKERLIGCQSVLRCAAAITPALNSEEVTVYKFDYTAVDAKPEARFT